MKFCYFYSMAWIFLLLCLLCFLYQLIYECILLFAITRHNKKVSSPTALQLPLVSVVICAKNEAPNLRENLPFIMQQDYPDFEVLVVDDGSEDQTSELLSQYSKQYGNLRILSLSKEEKKGAGKKYALRKGIENARHAVLLLTDADCRPATKNWVREMASLITEQHKIVLGVSPYKQEASFLNDLIRYETLQTTLQYSGLALLGLPYMSVGRNVCFDKHLWQSKTWTEEELSIPSGDDDLVIQTLASRQNTSVCLSKESFTYSKATKTWAAWIKQKMRHYEPGKLYKLSHRLILGSYLSAKLLFYLFLICYLFQAHSFEEAIALLCTFWLAMAIVNNISQKRLHMPLRRKGMLIYDLLYTAFTIALGSISRFKPSRNWK